MMRAVEFEEVREKLVALPELQSGKGADESDLLELVSMWGPLPIDFKQYLQEFGWLAFSSYELYGLGVDVPTHLNLLERSRELWLGDGEYKLPRELLPFYDSGGGWFYCLSKMHRGHPVVSWAREYEDLGEGQPYDERYLSWSQWLIDHILTSAR